MMNTPHTAPRKKIMLRNVASGSDAKAQLLKKGLTLTAFAAMHGFSPRMVSDVVRGVSKGLHGAGHEVASALGLKS
jgi:gp16 family phage-associated protein